MLNSFYVYNLAPLKTAMIQSIILDKTIFYLGTCQRQVLVSAHPIDMSPDLYSHYFRGAEAYQFLLEVTCGLKSKLAGESEVLAQFKLAFQSYVESRQGNGSLITIFEKLLKDTKDVRHQYLNGIGKNSYGGLVRRLFKQYEGQSVLVLGGGDLAYQILTNLKKHHPVSLSGRNPEKLSPLVEKFQTPIVDWKNYSKWSEFQLVVNTIGSEEKLLSHSDFFIPWGDNHKETGKFIDLGSPSPLDTPWATSEGVIRLQELFQLVGDLGQEKNEKISSAAKLIGELTQKRSRFFSDKNKAKLNAYTNNNSTNLPYWNSQICAGATPSALGAK